MRGKVLTRAGTAFAWMASRTAAALLLVLAAPAAFAQSAATQPQNSCASCHRELAETGLSAPAARFAEVDIHRESGFTCADCHGGDAAAGTKERSHDARRGFTGKPEGQAVITSCARCHSDAAFMRRYNPRQRVDQATEYATSVHGKRLAQGDRGVATCASCHGAHGIRVARDAQSPVYPTNVAGTCATCHASDTHMRGYTRPDGSPIPTNQRSEYAKSVHNTALAIRGDLSAPTCNDCHGNHGAAPPGVGSVANVCGTCHAAFAQKFATSVHGDIFDKGCVECHGNHAVAKPTDAMLGVDAGGVCGTCHGGADDKGAAAAAHMRQGLDGLNARLDRAGELLAGIRNAGMDVSGQELAMAEARTRLTLARTEMHASKVEQVDPVLAEGLALADRIDADGERALAELRFRRRGLAVSLVAILLVVVALALKVREIDRRQAAR